MLHFKAPLRRQRTRDQGVEQPRDQMDSNEPITGASSGNEADTGQSETEAGCEGSDTTTPCSPLSVLEDPFDTIDQYEVRIKAIYLTGSFSSALKGNSHLNVLH